MTGSISRRGRSSWRIKFDLDRDVTGKRKTAYCTIRGAKRDAEKKLTELTEAFNKGSYVEPSSVTVAEHVRARIINQWEATPPPDGITGKNSGTIPRAVGKSDCPPSGKQAAAEAQDDRP